MQNHGQEKVFADNLSSTSAKPEAPLMDSSSWLRFRMRVIGRQGKAPQDNMQNTKTVTLVNILLELHPMKIVHVENSHFYYIQKKGNDHIEHFNQN